MGRPAESIIHIVHVQCS